MCRRNVLSCRRYVVIKQQLSFYPVRFVGIKLVFSLIANNPSLCSVDLLMLSCYEAVFSKTGFYCLFFFVFFLLRSRQPLGCFSIFHHSLYVFLSFFVVTIFRYSYQLLANLCNLYPLIHFQLNRYSLFSNVRRIQKVKHELKRRRDSI